jgi:hypothetical protein
MDEEQIDHKAPACLVRDPTTGTLLEFDTYDAGQEKAAEFARANPGKFIDTYAHSGAVRIRR